MLNYKGYVGTVQHDSESGILFGRVLGLNTGISYEGSDISGLEKDLRNATDFYLDDCARSGEAPEKSYCGKVLLRLGPDLHEKATLAALKEGARSLNMWLKDLVIEKLAASAGASISFKAPDVSNMDSLAYGLPTSRQLRPAAPLSVIGSGLNLTLTPQAQLSGLTPNPTSDVSSVSNVKRAIDH